MKLNEDNSGKYKISAMPYQSDWQHADKIEIVLNLSVGNENRIFRGLISLMAISKEAKQNIEVRE